MTYHCDYNSVIQMKHDISLWLQFSDPNEAWHHCDYNLVIQMKHDISLWLQFSDPNEALFAGIRMM